MTTFLVLLIGLALGILLDRALRGPWVADDPAEETAIMDVQDVHVAALVKGNERYIWLWADGQAAEALQTLGRFASDPELSFTWFDAARVATAIRQEAARTEDERCRGR